MPRVLELADEFTAHLEIETCPRCDGSSREPMNKLDACHRCGGLGEIVVGTLIPDDLRKLRKAIKQPTV